MDSPPPDLQYTAKINAVLLIKVYESYMTIQQIQFPAFDTIHVGIEDMVHLLFDHTKQQC